MKDMNQMKFHKFFWYVNLPLSMSISIQNIAKLSISGLEIAGFATLVELAMVAVAVSVFIGFFSRKAYSWYGVFLLIGVGYLQRFTYITIDSSSASSLVFYFFYSMYVIRYYLDRKELFFENQQLAPIYNTIETSNKSNQAITQHNEAKFCWNCGNAAIFGSKFCSSCGAKMIINGDSNEL